MKRIAAGILLLMLSWFSVRDLAGLSYFPMHDDTQVERVIVMGKALSEGQFPVRWVDDLGYGYGYPIFNFYGPLPYYAGGILYALGVPAVAAAKIMFAAGIILPALVMYLTAYRILGWEGALVAGLFYLYAPYHAVEAYIRGAVGEYWVLVFWPLVVYGMLTASDTKRRRRAFLAGAAGIAGSVLSHTLLGYVTVVFAGIGLFVYWGVRTAAKTFVRDEAVVHAGIVAAGVALSAFFWLPAMFEMRFTDVAGQIRASANYRDHFVCAIQLWSSPWGFAGSSPDCIHDGLSFMAGKLHLLAAVAVLLIWVLRRVPKRLSRAALFSLCLAFIGLLFTLKISEPFWQMLPLFAYLQYPWRFLAFSVLGTSLSAGILVACCTRPATRVLTAALAVFALLYFNVKWFIPQYLYRKDSAAFETAINLRWRASRISDEYLPPAVPRPKDGQRVVSDTIKADSTVRTKTIISTAVRKKLVVESPDTADITVNVAYFPGWKIRVNGESVDPKVVNGTPELQIGPGQSVFDMEFTDTAPRILGNIISFVAGIGIITYAAKKKASS